LNDFDVATENRIHQNKEFKNSIKLF